jgi:non-specific serine/threonine protein kinase
VAISLDQCIGSETLVFHHLSPMDLLPIRPCASEMEGQWSVGIGWWSHGQPDRAMQLLGECLRLAHVVNYPRHAAARLEALAWIAAAEGNPPRDVVLIGAAEGLGRTVGASTVVLPHLTVFHEECERRARETLDEQALLAAWQQGSSLSFDDAVAYALNKELQSEPIGQGPYRQ